MEAIFRHILEVGITAGFAVIGVILIRLVCKKAPKWIAVLLWGLVGLRLLLPFSIESPVSVIPEIAVPSVSVPYSSQTPSQTPQTLPQEGEGGASSTGEAVTGDAQTPAADGSDEVSRAEHTPTVSLGWVASAVWLVGVAAMLLYALITYLGVWRRVRTATKEESGVYRSEAVGSPFILGVLRARIYVPYGMDGERLNAVLAHEKAHIKRGDHIIKPLGFLLLSVYWFQPLLWVAYVLLCRDIELACDERVVKTLDAKERREYSMALVTSAVGRRRIAACPLCFGEVAVKERVKTVMNYKKPAFWIVIAAVVLSIAAAVCLLTDPLSGTPYATLDGATLVFKRGDLQADSLELPKGDDYIAKVEFNEVGKVYFALGETDDRRMSVTVTMDKELYHNGRLVKEVTVPYNEEVVLYDTPDGSGVRATLLIELPSTEEYWYPEHDANEPMTLRRYANGDTVLYLYYKHFMLTDNGVTATDLQGMLDYNWQTSNDYLFLEYSHEKRPDTVCGRYEWVEDTLILTEDGGLTRYVFKVGEDGSLTHMKGELSRHKKATSPILPNRLELKHEYDCVAEKADGGNTHFTLSNAAGTVMESGETRFTNLSIVSYADGVIRVVADDPADALGEEHRLYDLSSGEELGTYSYAGNSPQTGSTGYYPMLCEKDGKVIVKAQYYSWCMTFPADNFLYELEGLSSLRNGEVQAIIDGNEIVITYTDDSGKHHVIAEELTGEGVPLERSLVAVTQVDADGRPLDGVQEKQYSDGEGELRYSRIAAAFVRIDGEYVDVARALTDGTTAKEQPLFSRARKPLI